MCAICAVHMATPCQETAPYHPYQASQLARVAWVGGTGTTTTRGLPARTFAQASSREMRRMMPSASFRLSPSGSKPPGAGATRHSTALVAWATRRKVDTWRKIASTAAIRQVTRCSRGDTPATARAAQPWLSVRRCRATAVPCFHGSSSLPSTRACSPQAARAAPRSTSDALVTVETPPAAAPQCRRHGA